jgi:hypothetical protein
MLDYGSRGLAVVRDPFAAVVSALADLTATDSSVTDTYEIGPSAPSSAIVSDKNLGKVSGFLSSTAGRGMNPYGILKKLSGITP